MRKNRYKKETTKLVKKNVKKPNQFVKKCHFWTPEKLKCDSSKDREKGSCWSITIMSNQLLHDKFILCECRLPPSSRDSWSLSHLGYLYPGTTPVMIKLDHNPAPPQQDPHVHLSSFACVNSPLPLGIPISPPHQPHPLHPSRVRDTELVQNCCCFFRLSRLRDPHQTCSLNTWKQ